MPGFKIVDWIAPGSLVLSLVGTLDAKACQNVKQRLQRLHSEWPGIRVTVELAEVDGIDREAVEDLFLMVVAIRARGSSLQLACPSAECVPVLTRLNMDFLSKLPLERPLVGVTA